MFNTIDGFLNHLGLLSLKSVFEEMIYDLRKVTRSSYVEFADTFSTDDPAEFDRIPGTVDGVYLQSHLTPIDASLHLANSSNWDYHLLHSHVTDASLSANDAFIFFNRPNVKISIVVGANSRVYLFGRVGRTPIVLKNADEVATRYGVRSAQGEILSYTNMKNLLNRIKSNHPMFALYDLGNPEPASQLEMKAAIDYTNEVCSLFDNLVWAVVDM